MKAGTRNLLFALPSIMDAKWCNIMTVVLQEAEQQKGVLHKCSQLAYWFTILMSIEPCCACKGAMLHQNRTRLAWCVHQRDPGCRICMSQQQSLAAQVHCSNIVVVALLCIKGLHI